MINHLFTLIEKREKQINNNCAITFKIYAQNKVNAKYITLKLKQACSKHFLNNCN